MSSRETISGLIIWAIAICGILVYLPISSGDFILDDWVHFPKMAGGINNPIDLANFLFNETGGTGRPLSFLTLLIEDNAWPTAAAPYKLNNILFHTLNYLLMVYLALAITRAKTNHKMSFDKLIVIVLLTAFWFLSPFQVSSVALTIQRMTLLSTMTILVSLIVYVTYRPKSGYELPKHWAALIFQGAMCVIGALFKENAVLLPLYIGCLEILLQNGAYKRTLRHKAFLLACVGPVAAFLLIYLTVAVLNHEQNYAHRNFTLLDRALIQPQILVEYLYKFFLLRTGGTGPYHDGISVSLDTTFLIKSALAFTFWLCLIVLSFKLRKKTPWPLFGLYWYLAGHSLESTVLPLELYFEHRNYAPSIGIIIALCGLASSSSKNLLRGSALLAIYILLATTLTYKTATFWGNQLIASRIWLNENPNSERASLEMMNLWLKHGEVQEAQATLRQSIELHPDTAAYPLTALYYTSCSNMTFDYTVNDIAQIASKSQIESGSIELLKILFDRYSFAPNSCKNLTREDLGVILKAYIENPEFSKLDRTIGILYTLDATYHIWRGDLNGAMSSLDKAYSYLKSINILLDQAYLLATAGLYQDAWVYIEKAKSAKHAGPFSFLWRDRAIKQFEGLIQDMITEASNQTQTQ